MCSIGAIHGVDGINLRRMDQPLLPSGSSNERMDADTPTGDFITPAVRQALSALIADDLAAGTGNRSAQFDPQGSGLTENHAKILHHAFQKPMIEGHPESGVHGFSTV